MAKKNTTADPQPNGNGTGDCPVTLKCFDDFVTAAGVRETDASNVAAALEIEFKGKQEEVCAERRNYKKAQDTLETYNNIYYCQVISLCKDIEQAQETVKLETDIGAQMKTSFDKVLASLKAVKTKLTNVKNLVGALETVSCDSCNSESKKAIDDKLGSQGSDPVLEASLELVVNSFKAMALDTEGAADQAYETAVITAGVLAFTNVPSIKPFTDELKSKCDTLKKDVEENVKTTSKTIESTQKSLSEALSQLSISEVVWRRSETVVAGIHDTASHVDTRSTKPNTPFEDIPDKVKEALSGVQKPSTGNKSDDA